MLTQGLVTGAIGVGLRGAVAWPPRAASRRFFTKPRRATR